MDTVIAGRATKKEPDGADFWRSFIGRLPPYYITKGAAKELGWKPAKGNLNAVVPGQMIGGDIYRNDDGKLSDEYDRIWYEADINYDLGFRGAERILFSNDGLIFVSYDHYETFCEIISGV